MRVFLTGATGFIGSAIVPQLVRAGHRVTGLARSDAAADALEAAGVEVRRGSLDHLDSLGAGAAAADGVIHTAFIHDFTRAAAGLVDPSAVDRRAIGALGDALEGSGKPLVITSGTALIHDGRVATEDMSPDPTEPGSPRSGSEQLAKSLASRGVRSSIVRPSPSVHGEGDHGFVPIVIDIARRKGVSGYIGDGANRWAAVHRLDIAPLYRLALEEAPAGTVLHGVGDEGVPTRDIAEVIGRHLDVPVVSIAREDADEHFGFLAGFFGMDAPASSTLTQQRFGWTPTHRGLIADLDAGHYFEQARLAVTSSRGSR